MAFDGYNKLSTKAMTRKKRASGKLLPLHHCQRYIVYSMPVTLKKDSFLSNPKNKQRFLVLLGQALENERCVTHHANGDADLLIVTTAIESAQTWR